MRASWAMAAAVGCVMSAAACTHNVNVHHTVDPIYMTIDLRVDRRLDEFFDFEKEVVGDTGAAPGATQAPPAQPGQPVEPAEPAAAGSPREGGA